MKILQRSAIAVIPLTIMSALGWTPLAQADETSQPAAQTETAAPAEAPVGLVSGTEIPVVLPGGNPDANLIVAVGESLDTSFEVAANVVDAQNRVIIPQGSTVSGTLESEVINQRNGARFRASTVTIGNQTYSLQATSTSFVAKRENQITVNDVTNSVSTVAAATVLNSAVNRIGGIGGIDSGILGGVKRGLGISILPTVLRTGQQLARKATSSSEVIVVEPDQMGLKLDSAFQLVPVATEADAAADSDATVATDAATPLTIASGTRLGLGTQTSGTRYVVEADETFPLELQVAEDVYSNSNQIVIPQGSLIKGSLTPANSGSIFKAEKLVIGDRTYPLDAQTTAIAPTDVTSLRPSDFTGNTVTSPQASATLSRIRDSVSSGGILGQLLGTSTRTQVVIFDPADATLELGTDLVLEAEA